MKRIVHDGLLSALVVAILSYSWSYSELTVPNERTRAYLAIALFDEHTLSVDGPVHRFGLPLDLATFNGRYYTDKAPGSSLLALPVYAAARLFHSPDELPLKRVVNLIRSYLMIPFGLLGFLALRALLRRLRIAEPALDVVSLGYSLGSAALHYSVAFYGHVLVASLALLCLELWGRAGAFGRAPIKVRPGAALGAGVCAGLLGLVEYQAVVLAGLLGLPALGLAPRLRLRGLALFALGGAPFAVALLWYNHAAFGSAFELSYHHLVDSSLEAMHGKGLAGATKPTWEALSGLTFSLHRGLFATSPLLLLGLFGMLMPGTMPRALRVTVLSSVVYFVGIVSASSVWHGGWAFGPRLLIPIMGFMALAAGGLLERFRGSSVLLLVASACALFGILYHASVQITFAELPPNVTYPLPQSVWPMLKAGLVAPNLACKVAPLGRANLLPLAALLGSACAVVALSGRLFGSRLAFFAGALLLAGSGLFAVARLGEPLPDAGQTGWLRYMGDMARRESGCHAPWVPAEAPPAPSRGAPAKRKPST